MNVCIGGAYLQNFMICILQARTPKPVFAASYDYTPVVKLIFKRDMTAY